MAWAKNVSRSVSGNRRKASLNARPMLCSSESWSNTTGKGNAVVVQSVPLDVWYEFFTILLLRREVHEIDNVLSGEPRIAVSWENAIRDDADAVSSKESGSEFLAVVHNHWQSFSPKSKEKPCGFY